MHDHSRLLITTLLEESWEPDVPVVFLGEWCRQYGRQSVWQAMDAKVLPFHWSDRGKLERDYEYLGEVFERLLPCLASALNAYHGVDHGVRYWRILVGPWLAYFSHTLFDRWESIQQAVRQGHIEKTIILKEYKELMVPDGMESFFSSFIFSHTWNHALYAHIIANFTDIPCVERSVKTATGQIGGVVQSHSTLKIKNVIRHALHWLLNPFVRERDAFFLNTYLPPLQEVLLHLKFHQVPQVWRSIPPVECDPYSAAHRNFHLRFVANNPFETFLVSMIEHSIPTYYIENYKKLMEQTDGLPWPRKPKLIFTSNALWHDTVAKAYTARHVEQGARLVYGQHGGFGIQKFCWAEKHELTIADRFISWGMWAKDGGEHIVPTGIFKPLIPYKGRNVPEKERLLMVRCLTSPYIFRIDSDIGLPQLLNTIEQCLTFAEHLPERLRNNHLTVRLFPLTKAFSSGNKSSGGSAENFFSEELRWKQRFPDVHVNDGYDPIDHHVIQSRLIVYTYTGGTGYLEYFASNIPVIIFTDMAATPVRETTMPCFEALRKVGIYHDNPESAARQVAQVWNDVEGWWNQPEVVRAADQFRDYLCHYEPNLLNRVTAALKETLLT